MLVQHFFILPQDRQAKWFLWSYVFFSICSGCHNYHLLRCNFVGMISSYKKKGELVKLVYLKKIKGMYAKKNIIAFTAVFCVCFFLPHNLRIIW